MNWKVKDFIISLLVVIVLPALVVWGISKFSHRKIEHQAFDVRFSAQEEASVQHYKFEILQQNFETPQQVTEACLSCHTERDKEIMQTAHWNWERTTEIPGRGEVTIGKKNLINNFCTGAAGNNGSCMRCHIGYGWEDKSFDFGNPKNIDCLVCHDQTDSYFKQKGKAGMPATEETADPFYQVPDYNMVAQNVGLPKRNNCGICHFYGGGGNNVKHGDLEEALLDCRREVDIHMSTETVDMQCIDCHKTEKHNISGKLYSVSSKNENRTTCEQCHTSTPHNDRIIDEHYYKVACQTCHIPQYAKVNSTKMWWDWSTAGKLDENGVPVSENDADGNHNYLSIKGNFVWDDHVKPEYVWFNGTADHYLAGDKIDEVPVKINELFGAYKDSASKIWPVKVHRGKQPYDAENSYLLYMKLYAPDKGQGAFWRDFNWDTAAILGMEYHGMDYSGNMDFVETEVYWPINHMVSPKEQTLSCTECHARESRLAGLTDFYLPGRDFKAAIDYFGIGIIILSILGVLGHSLIRGISGLKR